MPDALVAGCSIIRNATILDFPLEASVRSVLPGVDDFVLAVGASEDDTRERAERLAHDEPKVRLLDTVWDTTQGATVLSTQTNLALAACQARQRETGALLMHAYDQPEVVIGAGTLAAEIEADAGALPDRILVSVGGGGLVAGIAAWCAGRCRVDALEPERAPTLHAARERGQPVDVAVSGLAADSLGAQRIGGIAWEISRRWVDGSLLLPDEAIRAAQQRLWRDYRLAVEPAAALGPAALWSGALRPQPHERVAVVLCGANFDPASLA